MKKRLVLSMITHPIFILVYGISFYELYTLCKFGRINKNIPLLIACMIFFFLWFVAIIVRIVKNKKTKCSKFKKKFSLYKVIWNVIAIIVIAIITAFYGGKIYQSGIEFNGKLSWVLHDLKNKKTIEFKHDNVYKNGVEGIFTDINKKISMPEKLYMANNFTLNFDSKGIITSFDTFLYGKNKDGELKSYLITYSKNKSHNITIYLNGHVNANYNKNKLIKPLFQTMKVIKLKNRVKNWKENQYRILYNGKQSFGYNTDGIVYINSKGGTKVLESAKSEIIEYTVSVFVPGKEKEYTPIRYILRDNF